MKLPANLEDLDRFVSLNWQEFEACGSDEIEAFAAFTNEHHISRLEAPSDFVIANGLLKLRDLICPREGQIRSALTVNWRTVRRSSSKPEVQASPTAAKETIGEFKEIVIVASAVTPSVQALAFTLDAIVGVRPRIYLLKHAELAPHPPWHSSGAWYAKGPVSASPSIELAASDIREIEGWMNFANTVAHERSTLFLLCGMPLLPKRLFDFSSAAILNVHNGILPGMRGMDSPAWSFVYGLPPCITLHMVDEGVDSGKPLQVRNTFGLAGKQAFSKAAYQRAKAQVLADCLTGSPQGEIMLSMVKQDNPGNLPTGNRIHYGMHPTLRNLISTYCD